MGKLGQFEGVDVLGAALEVKNAAGGLNEALKIDPEMWHKDDEVTVVLRCKVRDIDHRPIKDVDGWTRVHVLTATEAAVIDDDLVSDALDAQSKRIEQAKIQREQEKGVYQLDAAMTEAHEEGAHADGLVEGCPACDAEREAEAAEATG